MITNNNWSFKCQREYLKMYLKSTSVCEWREVTGASFCPVTYTLLFSYNRSFIKLLKLRANLTAEVDHDTQTCEKL